MAVAYGKGDKGKATRLHSQIVRTTGYCEKCGRENDVQLQCAHIIGRKYSFTRTDLRNAFCLCAGCHRWFTDHPREFSKFITDTWAQEHYDDIYALSQESRQISHTKVDWKERAEFLKDILKQIEAEELTLEEAREYEKTYWS